MKKLFLFVAASALAVSLNSCSGDDSSSSTGGSITAKINGTTKTFDNVVVNEESFPNEDGGTYTELTVTGTIGNSASELITFSLEKGDVGSEAVWSFNYTANGQTYYDNGQLNTVVQTNSASGKLKGNFSGTLQSGNSATTITIADGSFNFSY
jgi:hypothetical protein